MKSLLQISLLNIGGHKAFFVKLITVLSCIVFAVTSYFTYVFALETQYDTIIKENISSNYFSVEGYINSDVRNRISDSEFIEYLELNDSLYLDKIGPNGGQLSYGMAVAVINGNEMYSANKQAYEQVKIIAYNIDKQLFSQTENEEFQYRYSNDNLLIDGSYPKNANEILVNKRFLDMYGLNSLPTINKHLSLKVNDHSQTVVFDNYKITGIISNKLGELSGYEGIFPSIIFSSKALLFLENAECTREFTKIFLKNYNINETEKILKENNLNYNYNSQFSLMRINNIINQKTMTSKLFSIIAVALIIALLITLLMLIKQLFTLQSMNSGILLTYGINKKNLLSIHIIELLFAFFAAVILGAVMNKAFMLIATKLLQKMMFIELLIKPVNTIFILLIVSLTLLAVLLSVTLILFKKEKSKSIKQLLLN